MMKVYVCGDPWMFSSMNISMLERETRLSLNFAILLRATIGELSPIYAIKITSVSLIRQYALLTVTFGSEAWFRLNWHHKQQEQWDR
jgi:hypothetical protein